MPVSMRFSAHSLLSQSHINTVRVTTAPVNMPDPIQKHFDYGHYGQHTARIGLIVYARSNFPHPFQFSFFNEGMGHTVQNRPGFDLDGLVRFWAKGSGTEANRCVRIRGFTSVQCFRADPDRMWMGSGMIIGYMSVGCSAIDSAVLFM